MDSDIVLNTRGESMTTDGQETGCHIVTFIAIVIENRITDALLQSMQESKGYFK